MSNDAIRKRLAGVYEEVMWLAKRPHVTPAAARSWYTHVAAVALKIHIRRFSGKISKSAVNDYLGPLRLEHYLRIQTNLTQLVERHLLAKKPNPKEFIDCVIKSEEVHIVTVSENYSIMRAKGDYKIATVDLVDWEEVPSERKSALWKRILRGRVANASDFKP